MEIQVYQGGKGDALLLTSETGKHILVDGGIPETYKKYWGNLIAKLRTDGEPIELVCVSHIDRDHIGGILEMMDNEVEWRLYEARRNNPNLRRRARRFRAPAIKRPPEIKAFWHNALWEDIRRGRLRQRHAASLDAGNILSRCAEVYAGAGDMLMGDADAKQQVTAAQAAGHMQFLGQSVGDAIELSRRIGAKQLKIPLNPQFGGKFVLRKRQQGSIAVADFNVTVLGPTLKDLEKLKVDWNKWLEEKSDYLKRLLKRHDRDAERLAPTSVEDVIGLARESALALAGNQHVTAPNLASIIMLAENDGRSMLLTGDADDVSIMEGLKAQRLLDESGQIHVDVFKIPHHGADNSYSDELARTVTANHYLFCGDGKNSNPEHRVVKGYLKMLLDGDNHHAPALPAGVKPKLWFTSGPDHATSAKLKKHWKKMEILLREWQASHPNSFTYHFQKNDRPLRVK